MAINSFENVFFIVADDFICSHCRQMHCYCVENTTALQVQMHLYCSNPDWCTVVCNSSVTCHWQQQSARRRWREKLKGRDFISHFECCHKHTVVEGVSVEQEDKEERVLGEQQCKDRERCAYRGYTDGVADEMGVDLKSGCVWGLLKELCSEVLLREQF